MPDIAAAVARHVATTLGRPFTPTAIDPVSGGCINRALVLRDPTQRYFVKLNGADRAEMFAAEADGLEELHAAGALRVPRPICAG